MDKEKHTPEQAKPVNRYKGLPQILHGVRYTQHLLAIIAEVLILASLAMSGMDASLGGVMANIAQFKWTWAAAFALGVDTSFVIAWVRVRQCASNRKWAAFAWNLLLAVGMSFIVFQPAAIQFLQQAMAINFNQALAMLGINVVILAYARAGVAVLLGAILAMTNVESAMKSDQTDTAQKPKRRLIIFDNMLNKYAPVVSSEQSQDAQVVVTEEPEPPLKQIEPRQSAHLHVVSVNVDVEPVERARAVLKQEPGCSDRRLGRLTNLAPATAKKYRLLIEAERSKAM